MEFTLTKDVLRIAGPGVSFETDSVHAFQPS